MMMRIDWETGLGEILKYCLPSLSLSTLSIFRWMVAVLIKYDVHMTPLSFAAADDLGGWLAIFLSL